jgi:hypothetical protein
MTPDERIAIVRSCFDGVHDLQIERREPDAFASWSVKVSGIMKPHDAEDRFCEDEESIYLTPADEAAPETSQMHVLRARASAVAMRWAT